VLQITAARHERFILVLDPADRELGMGLPQRTTTLPPFAGEHAEDRAELHDSRVVTILEQPQHDEMSPHQGPIPLGGVLIGVIAGAVIWTLAAIVFTVAFVG
jgi:hypothetical protein